MTISSEPIAPALSFKRLSKSFGGTPALNEVTFDVKPAELFGLVGCNGAGKTTLIKCLLDFCAVDSGGIDIFGESHLKTSARRTVAFLPERFSPPFYLTGRDFLRYMAELHRKTYEEELVRSALEQLDLDLSALERPARAYSKGMTQKLGLCACLLSGKPLQVLDEPTSGLDPKARALLKRRFTNFRSAGGTVFFSSHALADVEEICDRMAVMHGGYLRFLGTPAALKFKYGTTDLEQAFLSCIEEAIAA